MVMLRKIAQFLYLRPFPTTLHLSELQISADFMGSIFITGYRMGNILKINWNLENKNV